MGEAIVGTVDVFAREAMLFAAAGFLLGGLDDLVIDLIWLARRAIARRQRLDRLPAPPIARPIAIFVPTWREQGVIAAMLRTALARIDHPAYRIFVGCYPNDQATIDAVAAVAQDDARVRLVTGPHDGPTSKGDNLNTLWNALRREDAAAAQAAIAVVLHDAEDVVDANELRVVDALIDDHAAVQISVLPLIDPAARLVSGHYADEFAEAHGRVLPVRVALGAGMPLAGVGCAIRVDMLAALTREHGTPFAGDSLTEDYELGLRIGARGGGGCFARVEDAEGRLIATRAYFPARLHDAVVQKARWLRGIALAGWDRTGWGRPLQLSEHWMRMRDRRGPLVVLVLGAAYVGLLCWAGAALGHWWLGSAPPALSPALAWLLRINALLLGWRLVMRAAFTGRAYGWREALWSVPRMFVGNVVAILAARRAIDQYARAAIGQPPVWDKTEHAFPHDLAEPARG